MSGLAVHYGKTNNCRTPMVAYGAQNLAERLDVGLGSLEDSGKPGMLTLLWKWPDKKGMLNNATHKHSQYKGDERF